MHMLFLFLASFLASAVEMVEALTIVLAAGVTRWLALGLDWRGRRVSSASRCHCPGAGAGAHHYSH